MEEYKGIENCAPDIYDARSTPNAIAKTPTREGQQLELWSPVEEITNQMRVKLEENQLDNAGVFRATSGNAR